MGIQNTSMSASSPNTYQQQGISGTERSQNLSPYTQNANQPSALYNTRNSQAHQIGSYGSPSQSNSWSVPTIDDEISRIVASDSLTMQQAKNEGLRTAGNRGLLNSSISGQAAQQAAVQTAAPIAEKNVANQLEKQRFAQGVTANTHGEYMKATQEIINNAAISINEIETAQGTNAAYPHQKDAMIANTIKRRDADLKFIKEFYSAMPTWSGNWYNFPTMQKAPGVS